MRVAIIGAGFTGLSAAYQLIKRGHEVTVFERNELAGGLASGVREDNWQWRVEKHYHHLFVSDNKIITLAQEINLPIVFKRPKTCVRVDNQIFPLDSVLQLLRFSKLNFFERLRMGIALFYLKTNPFWKPLETISAEKWLTKFMGEKAYQMIWEPLLSSKFGDYKEEIPLSWFWARIKKRSSHLGYPEGGFQNLVDALMKKIEQKGGEIFLKSEVLQLKETNNSRLLIKTTEGEYFFDKVIVTLPSALFLKIAPNLPKSYQEKLLKLKSLGALNLLLILKKPFLEDGTYWLNICEKDYPFLSVVEHTNFIDKKYYGGNHLVYIGNYLPLDHPYFSKTAGELLKIYDPYLRKINPNYKLSAISCVLSSAPFAQPVISLNYSKTILPFKTPIKNVYLANIEQVYPWDRGINYAVELGEKVAELVISH